VNRPARCLVDSYVAQSQRTPDSDVELGDPGTKAALPAQTPPAEIGHFAKGYLKAEQVGRLTRRHGELGQKATKLVRNELPTNVPVGPRCCMTGPTSPEGMLDR
jgi:hypothetical protein